MRYTLGLQHFFTIAKYLLRFKHPPYPLMTTIYLIPLAMSQDIPWKLGPNESNIQPTASIPGSPPCTKLLLINPPTLLVSLRFFSWDSTVCPIKTSPHQTEGYGANFANSNACTLRKASTTHLCTERDLSAWAGQRSKDTCSQKVIYLATVRKVSQTAASQQNGTTEGHPESITEAEIPPPLTTGSLNDVS